MPVALMKKRKVELASSDDSVVCGYMRNEVSAECVNALRQEFPNHTVPFLTSILEAAHSHVGDARELLVQLASVDSSARPKRRRPSECMEDDESPPEPPPAAEQEVDERLNQCLGALQGVSTLEEARERLRHVLRDLLPKGTRDSALLRKAILTQASIIANARQRERQLCQENDSVKQQLRLCRARAEESERQLRKTREINNLLTSCIRKHMQQGDTAPHTGPFENPFSPDDDQGCAR